MEKIRFNYPNFTGGYGCSKPNVETDDYYRASKVDALLSDVAKLVEAAKAYIKESGHWNYCGAVHGPEHETWTVEEDCNCELKPFKQAIAAVEARIGEK